MISHTKNATLLSGKSFRSCEIDYQFYLVKLKRLSVQSQVVCKFYFKAFFASSTGESFKAQRSDEARLIIVEGHISRALFLANFKAIDVRIFHQVEL